MARILILHLPWLVLSAFVWGHAEGMNPDYSVLNRITGSGTSAAHLRCENPEP